MADFVIEGGFDDRAILEGFKRLVDEGTKAGRRIGAGFDDELNRFGKRSIASLQQELSRLQSRQLRVNVDSTAFTKTSEKIKEVQKLIDQANSKKLLLSADPGSVVAVRQRLLDINQQLERVKIGSRSFEILSAQAQAAQRQLNLASRQTQNIANDLIGLALPAGGSLGAVLALGQALRFVGDQARQFDSAAAAVRTLGVNSEDLAKRLKVVSRETGGARSEVELLRAAYDVASAGFADAASAAQILEASARGATGGFSDINTVANATTSVLNAYGLSADQASTLVDKFIQTQNDGKITVGQLADQIGKLAPIAASAGVSIDEFGAAIAAATVAGVQPEAAVTGLRQAISSIIKPSKDAEEVASRLGVGFNAAALQSKGLSGVLSDIALKTKGNAALNLQLFGSVEALTAVQPLLNDELVKFNKLLLNQRNSAGVAKKAADEVANTVEGATKRIQGSLSNLGVELGKLSSPVIIESLDLLGAGLNTVAGNLEKIFALPGGGEFLTGLLSNANKEAKILTKGQEGLIQGSLRLAQILGNSAGLASNAGQLITSAAQAKIFGKDLDKAGVAAKKVADQVGKLPAATGKAAKSGQALTDQTEAAARAEEDRAKQVERAAAAEKARAKTIAEINELRRQEPVRRLDDQITVGRSLLNFAQASVGLEQERFNTARARNQYEIDNAEALGLTQNQIAARERENDRLRKQSLIEQYKSLLQTQAIESVMLALSQRQALTEAQITVNKAKQAAIEAQIAVTKARTPEERAQALEGSRLAQLNVGYSLQSLEILQRTIPLETAAAQAAGELARQQLRTQGASLGIEQALLNIAPAQEINNQAFNDGVAFLNQLNGAAGNLVEPIKAASQAAEPIIVAYKDANGSIVVLQKSAENAEESFKGLGENAENAQESVKAFKDANLDKVTADAAGSARSFASSMNDAAGSAQQLLQSLSQASGLSPSRFTGGPVDAGTRYRINDGPGGRSLGQESFLSSAGDLSLINRPFSSLWTAPSAGIVLPAVLTDQLKERGAFDTGRRGGKRIAAAVAAGARPGGQSTTDRLEAAVTNLAAQVQALNRKSWTVQQRVTNSPGTTQVRLLSSML